uniref:G_PROTEIN_RECEP_F1_2 domain-containing protein n=1 Tax=Panagrellus redivivus TaxID=6233 RepID=A0A7E4V300_PANRE
MWLYIVNSLIATYGFLIVVLCYDRYVALNDPLYYRISFVRLRVRIYLVTTCAVIACLCCLKWVVFNEIEPDETISENQYVTGNAYYIIFRTVATLVQYFISGIIMVILSVKNALKLRALDKAHFHELRMSEGPRNQWTKNHKTTANICIFLAFSYIIFNWPYALTDYFYTDALFEKRWYAIFEMIINLSQIVYIQLNLVFFAYCSKTYRSALMTAFRKLRLTFRAMMGSKVRGKAVIFHNEGRIAIIEGIRITPIEDIRQS